MMGELTYGEQRGLSNKTVLKLEQAEKPRQGQAHRDAA
jgi:hypothetical protein